MFKPLQLSDSATAVSVLDPAIDWDKMVADLGKAKEQLVADARAEAETSLSGSAAKLAVKPGMSLTRFVLGVIPGDEMARITDETSPAAGRSRPQERFWRAFLASVRDIDGFEPKPKRGRTVNGVEYCDVDWLKSTFIKGLRVVACEIGVYAWCWNQLTEEETKN